MALSSWDCKGCTNLCYRITGSGTGTYCKPMMERRHRTKWRGDKIICLDYTTDPAAMDKSVKLHDCIMGGLKNELEENEQDR